MLLERWDTRSRSIHQSRNDVKGKKGKGVEFTDVADVCLSVSVRFTHRSLSPQGFFRHMESPQDDGRPVAVFRHSGATEGQSARIYFETRTTLWIRWFTQPCVDARVCWRRAISNAPSISSNPTSSTTCLTTRETRPSSVGGTSTSLSSGSCGRLRYFKEFSDNFILNNKRAEILALKKKNSDFT